MVTKLGTPVKRGMVHNMSVSLSKVDSKGNISHSTAAIGLHASIIISEKLNNDGPHSNKDSIQEMNVMSGKHNSASGTSSIPDLVNSHLRNPILNFMLRTCMEELEFKPFNSTSGFTATPVV
ncbi:hypothetical protein TNCV_922411 [Trichonephila clavipes]|nr:hypothetical protein TNCV_922411 [Trichonephila clavipes]